MHESVEVTTKKPILDYAKCIVFFGMYNI